jgi:hypothetical protein
MKENISIEPTCCTHSLNETFRANDFLPRNTSSFVSTNCYGKILLYDRYHAPNWKSRPGYILAAWMSCARYGM